MVSECGRSLWSSWRIIHAAGISTMTRMPRTTPSSSSLSMSGVSSALVIDTFSRNIASDFWYLTGFEEPDAAVIPEKTSTSRGHRMTLFSSGKDSHKEKWDGARTSFNDASSMFKADDAQSIQSFPDQLKSLASIYSNIYFDVSNSSKRSPRTAKSLLRYLSSPVQPRSEYDTIVESLSASRRHDLAPHVVKLRAIKSE
ncbi:Creatinase/Aminopeptidase P [Boletus edulis]|nr:Creatinase/Aminopeptidase P [Boletus edulis]